MSITTTAPLTYNKIAMASEVFQKDEVKATKGDVRREKKRRRQKKNNAKAQEAVAAAATASSSSSSSSTTTTTVNPANEQDNAHKSGDDVTKTDISQKKLRQINATIQKLTGKGPKQVWLHNKAIIKSLATLGLKNHTSSTLTTSPTTTQLDFWVSAIQALFPFMPAGESAARLLVLCDLEVRFLVLPNLNVTSEIYNPWSDTWPSFAYMRDVLKFRLDQKTWVPLLRNASENWKKYRGLQWEIEEMLEKVVGVNPFELPITTPAPKFTTIATPFPEIAVPVTTIPKTSFEPVLETATPLPKIAFEPVLDASEKFRGAHDSSVLHNLTPVKNIFGSMALKNDEPDDNSEDETVDETEDEAQLQTLLPISTRTNKPSIGISKSVRKNKPKTASTSPENKTPSSLALPALLSSTTALATPQDPTPPPEPLSLGAGSNPPATAPVKVSLFSQALGSAPAPTPLFPGAGSNPPLPAPSTDFSFGQPLAPPSAPLSFGAAIRPTAAPVDSPFWFEDAVAAVRASAKPMPVKKHHTFKDAIAAMATKGTFAFGAGKTSNFFSAKETLNSAPAKASPPDPVSFKYGRNLLTAMPGKFYLFKAAWAVMQVELVLFEKSLFEKAVESYFFVAGDGFVIGGVKEEVQPVPDAGEEPSSLVKETNVEQAPAEQTPVQQAPVKIKDLVQPEQQLSQPAQDTEQKPSSSIEEPVVQNAPSEEPTVKESSAEIKRRSSWADEVQDTLNTNYPGQLVFPTPANSSENHETQHTEVILPLSTASEQDVCDHSETSSKPIGATSSEQECDIPLDGKLDHFVELFLCMAKGLDTSDEVTSVAMVEEETVAPIEEKTVASIEEKIVCPVKEDSVVPAEESATHIQEPLTVLLGPIMTRPRPRVAIKNTTPAAPRPKENSEHTSISTSTKAPLLSLDFMTLEDLESWANDIFEARSGPQHIDFQPDQTAFRDLFEPGFLVASVLGVHVETVVSLDKEREMVDKQDGKQDSKRDSGRVGKQDTKPDSKVPSFSPTSVSDFVVGRRVTTSVSATPVNSQAISSSTDKTVSTSERSTQTDKLPDTSSTTHASHPTPLSPSSDNDFALTTMDFFATLPPSESRVITRLPSTPASSPVSSTFSTI